MLFFKKWGRTKVRSGTARSSVLYSNWIAAILALLLSEDIALPPSPEFDTQIFVSGLSRPIAMRQVPGDNSRFYIAEQGGLIRVVENGSILPTAMLNLTTAGLDFNDDCNEMGFLGMAFDPDYTNNGFVYVYYSSSDTEITSCFDGNGGSAHESIISRFTRDTNNSNLLDPSSRVEVMTIPQPYGNHNGGNILFGPDDNLYIGLGDGGLGGDPDDTGQDTTGWLGSMLRIDVSSLPYSIPASNPFEDASDDCIAEPTDDCGEIFAHGLRNPWRWSFDRTTGDLWIGDVGQGAREEASRIANADFGNILNLGWDCREGSIAHSGSSSSQCSNPTGAFIDPVTDYSRTSPDCSVTGGYVYRGTAISSLQGYYVFADYCSGRVRIIPSDAEIGSSSSVLEDEDFFISTFSEDNDGELYYTDFFGGIFYKMVPVP